MDTWLSWKNKPNQSQSNPIQSQFPKTPKMNLNTYPTKPYENKPLRRRFQNKPNQSQFQTQPAVSLSNLFQTQPVVSLSNLFQALSCLLNGWQEINRLLSLFINPMLPLYKPANAQYYSWYKRRCSSMVEHSFRKAEVEGPTPSIGFVNLREKYNSLQKIIKELGKVVVAYSIFVLECNCSLKTCCIY
jgi:hypothetical protein